MRRVVKMGLALVVVVGVGASLVHRGGGEVIAAPAPLPERADVVALVNGDTFDVRFNDQITRVSLLNVDAPTLPAPRKPDPGQNAAQNSAQYPAPDPAQNPGQSPAQALGANHTAAQGQCLGPEAAAELARLIPVGTPLTLTYDKDRFGRTAAIATTADGRIVNAEMVRSGLAQVVGTDARSPVPAPVLDAAQEAVSANRGLHSSDVPCTVPGRVKATTALAATLPAGPPPGAGEVDLTTAANSATDVRNAAAELVSAFDQNRQTVAWLVLDQGERAALDAQTHAAMDRADAAQTALRDAANVIANQDATADAGRTEVALIAARLAKIRKAEADRAAEAASRAAAARKAQADAAAEAAKRAADADRARTDADKDKKDDGDKRDDSKDSGGKKDDSKDSGGKKDDSKDSGGKKDDGGSGHGGGGGGGKKKDN